VAQFETKSFDEPDEVREPWGRTHIAGLRVGEHLLERITFEPGWTWQEDAVPFGEPALCERTHVVLVFSGVLAVDYGDGERTELRPGHVGVLKPGHDAWVVGDEPFVFSDLGGLFAVP
jgi:quercetin dioxygenase-like cupin family protein